MPPDTGASSERFTILMDGQAVERVTQRRMANAIRALAMDAVEAAASGHPGMPMGMADVATVLFTRFLKFDPKHPEWPDRDRFVLSAGHGSMLLYALLHLSGYADMSLDEIRRFRQLGSRTAGHPEYGASPGIETTTGPLGQGFANAVGMALGERIMADRFGDLVDHRTWVIAGDGCLMEGISHEAASLAGHLALNRLIVLFDDNGVSIDGPTSLAVSDDALARFRALNWAVESVDGHDGEAIADALGRALDSDRPSLIACRTVIGFGSPGKAGTAAAHGAPLGADEVSAARSKLGWDDEPFVIPGDILDAWREAGRRNAPLHEEWQRKLDALDASVRGEFERRMAGDIEDRVRDVTAGHVSRLIADPVRVATRKASELALDRLTGVLPEMIGGSADLTGSNNTRTTAMADITAGDYSGTYVRYGVREHAMAAAMTGMALHGGIIPYGGTFLAFTDYCRPSIRLAALMQQRVIYVMTHDSIGLGEDGPTHQPVEHLASLRAIPNLNVYRPADAIETAECWELALTSQTTPSVIALSRQGLPQARHEPLSGNLCSTGAYVIREASAAHRATIVASGSEVAIAIEAGRILEDDGIGTRIVSMPCQELFRNQARDARAILIPRDRATVAVEASLPFGWTDIIGEAGGFVGINGFGESAPAGALYEHFGITPEAVVEAVRQRL